MNRLSYILLVCTSLLFTSCGNEMDISLEKIVKTYELAQVPIATFTQFSTNEDMRYKVKLVASDPQDDLLYFTLESNATHGTILFSEENATFEYTPSKDYYGDDSFSYKVSDGDHSVVQNVAITIASVNDAPIPADNNKSVDEDAKLETHITATDADGDSMSFSLIQSSSHGTLVFDTNGSYAYTPNSNYNGTDTFSYSISDGIENVAQSVVITVIPINDRPEVGENNTSIYEDSVLSKSLIATDIDANDTLTYTTTVAPIHGTIELNSSGAYSYTPNSDHNGIDTFTFSVNDGFDSVTQVVTLTILGVNDAPLPADNNTSTQEDSTLTKSLNVFDADGDTLKYAMIQNCAHGVISMGSNGAYTYVPAINFFGTDTFSYSVSDDKTSVFQVVTITVASVNDAPVFTNNDNSVDEDVPLAATLSATDVEGDTLSYTATKAPTHGTLVVNTNGSYTYMPTSNYNGSDSFDANVSDDTKSVTQSVTLTVLPVNDTPIMSDNNKSVNEDGALSLIDLAVNDVDGDNLSYSLVKSPTNGTLSLSSSGVYSYTPSTNYNGNDTFTYEVSDGKISVSQTVTLTVTAVNDAPVVVTNYIGVSLNTAIDSQLVASDIDSSTLTFAFVDSNVTGVAISSAGVLTYNASASVHKVLVHYFVSDGTTTVTKELTLDIGSSNVVPTPTTANFSVDEDTLHSGTLTASDFDGDTLTYILVSAPTHASTFSIASNGTLSYKGTANYNGTDSFSYIVSDSKSYSVLDTVTITVSAVNDAPVANAASITLDEDTPKSYTLSGSDIEGSTLSYSIVTAPSHGSATLNSSTGVVAYTPTSNYNGSDSFVFKVNDGTVDSASVTVPLTINAINDRPTVSDTTLTLNEDTNGTNTITGSDVEGNTLSYSIVTAPSHGSATLNSSTGVVVYTPTSNYNGSDTLTYKVNDGTLDSTTATLALTISAVNDIPVANPAGETLTEDVVSSYTLSGSDIENSSLTFSIVTQSSHGTATITASTGVVVYTPTLNYNGSDSFAFKVNDGTADSATVTVPLTITAVNDAPVVVDNTNPSLQEDAISVRSISSKGSDVDGDTLSFSIVSATTHGTISITTDGTFTYTPDANYIGADSFTFKVNDGTLDSNVATNSITVVNANNDAPVGTYSTANTNEDLTINGTLTATDPDGSPIVFSKASDPLFGTVTVNAFGAFTYTPKANFHGPDSFSYKVEDDTALSSTQVVVVNVASINDPITSAKNIEMPYCETDGLSVIANWQDSANVQDVDLINPTATVTTNGLYGTFKVVGDMVSYTVTNNAATMYMPYWDKATVTIDDGQGSTSTITATIINGCQQVEVGEDNTYIIKRDHTLYGWGRNDQGQLADGTTTNRLSPINMVQGWSKVSAQGHRVLAINDNGTLYASGRNTYGQLGDGTTTTRLGWTKIGEGWKTVFAGWETSYGIKTDGTLWAWGYNGWGEMGDNTNVSKYVPTQIGTDTDWKEIDGGVYHALALKENGELWSWGRNDHGQVGDGSMTNRYTPTKRAGLWRKVVGSYWFSIGIDTAGALYTWGQNNTGQLGNGTLVDNPSMVKVGTDTDWVEIGGGRDFAFATKRNQLMYYSGQNVNNIFGSGSTNTVYKSFVNYNGAILAGSQACGRFFCAGVNRLNYFYSIGSNTYGELGTGDNTVRTNWTNIASMTDTGKAYYEQLEGGRDHAVAIRKNGSLWSAGVNPSGQLGNGSFTNSLVFGAITNPSKTWIKVAAFEANSAAIDKDGDLYVWGDNAYGQLGDGTTTSNAVPRFIASDVVDVKAGNGHFLVLKVDGSLHSEGWNAYGELGIGSKTNSSSLVQITGLNDCAKIEVGGAESYCIKKEGTLWAWGRGSYGALGLGENSDHTTPTQVGTSQMWSSLTSFAVSVYGFNDGGLYVWGNNINGQLGDGTTADKNSPTYLSSSYTNAYAAVYHVILQDSTNALYATGYAAWGSLGDGTRISRSTPVALNIQRDKVFTGLSFNFAIYADALYGWGANYGGEMGTGTTGDYAVPTKLSY